MINNGNDGFCRWAAAFVAVSITMALLPGCGSGSGGGSQPVPTGVAEPSGDTTGDASAGGGESTGGEGQGGLKLE